MFGPFAVRRGEEESFRMLHVWMLQQKDWTLCKRCLFSLFTSSYINTHSPGPDISNQMAAASRSFLPGVTLCQPVTIGASKLLARGKDSRVTSCCGNSWLARLWTVCVHVNNRGRITWMRANPSLDRFHFFFFSFGFYVHAWTYAWIEKTISSRLKR